MKVHKARRPVRHKGTQARNVCKGTKAREARNLANSSSGNLLHNIYLRVKFLLESWILSLFLKL